MEAHAQPRGRPTLASIAEATGLSKATVSLVLRHSPTIPERTRERVLQAARELGYVYNRGAASLRARDSLLIGISVIGLANPYTAELLAQMEDALSAEGRVALISDTRDLPARQMAFVTALREYNVDGLLLVPAVGTDADFAATLRDWQLPFVCVLRAIAGVEVDLVHIDHRAGMMSAVEHLLELGHRRIAFASVNESTSTGQLRYDGYRQALAQAGIPFEPSLVMDAEASRDAGMAQALALLDLPQPPSACVCFNDAVAFGVMLGVRARGLEVGRDLSVVGFDDVAEATLWRPALSTVSVARKDVARRAVELLLQRIAQPAAPPQSILLPTELIIRDTTAPPTKL